VALIVTSIFTGHLLIVIVCQSWVRRFMESFCCMILKLFSIGNEKEFSYVFIIIIFVIIVALIS
jgi:hypothetical protein